MKGPDLNSNLSRYALPAAVLTAAMALAACGSVISAPGGGGAVASSPATAAAKPKTLTPFKWLFGFRIQAGAALPIVIAKDLGYYADQGLDLTWDVGTDQTSIRLIGINGDVGGAADQDAQCGNHEIRGPGHAQRYQIAASHS